MNNATVSAAYELITVIGIGTFCTGLLLGICLGFALWRYKTGNKALPTSIPGEPIEMLIPIDDPLAWNHLPVTAEREQAL